MRHQLSKHIVLCCGLMLLTVFSSSIYATPIFYSDRSAFLEALPDASDIVFQDFEGIEPFGSRVGGAVSLFEFPFMTLESELPAIKLLDRAYSGSRNTTPGGKRYLSIDTDLRRQGTSTSFTFSPEVIALGFNLIDHDADDAGLMVGGEHVLIPEVNDGESVFLGVVFDSFNRGLFNFSLDIGRDSQVALDDFIFVLKDEAMQVDEPNTLLLFSVACLMLLGSRSRRY